MKFLHINKFGINEMLDVEQVKLIGIAKEADGKPCIDVWFRDGMIRQYTSDELSKSAGKCHELLRELGKALEVVTVGNDKTLKMP